jgi:hypothetical protein
LVAGAFKPVQRHVHFFSGRGERNGPDERLRAARGMLSNRFPIVKFGGIDRTIAPWGE